MWETSGGWPGSYLSILAFSTPFPSGVAVTMTLMYAPSVVLVLLTSCLGVELRSRSERRLLLRATSLVEAAEWD